MTNALPTAGCPYIGLRYFEESDAALFYGRDDHVTELLAKFSAHRLIAVLGSSGSGKSSLVRAGLLPELRAGMIPQAGSRWKVVEFQPKNDPLGELAHSLWKNLGVENAREILAEGPIGLVNVIRASRLAAGTNVLVIADQFEEVFRFEREAPEQEKQAAAEQCRALVRRLLDAEGNFPIYILLVMRSDYLGECAQFPDLPERMSESLYVVPRLRRDELQQAITAPVDDNIEPALVQRLLSDLGNDQDQLPRLQHLLTRLWKHSQAHRLSIEDYNALGGWQGGLSGHLNEIYDPLTRQQQGVCCRIFQRLSDRDESNRAIRRRATLRELDEVCGSRQDVVAVIEAFRREGFLRPPGELCDETLIDLTHECILRGWDKLTGTANDKGWLQKESEVGDFYRELKRRSRRSLLTDSDLRTALCHLRSGQFNTAWARRYGSDSDFTEVQNYVDRSRSRHRLDQFLRISAIVGCFALLITIFSVLIQTARASRQGEQHARARELIADATLYQTTDPATALFLGWQARWLLTPALEDVFYQALAKGGSRIIFRGHQNSVWSVAWSPDGKSIASAAEDKTVKLWDAATGHEFHTLAGHQSSVLSVAWSPDGKSIASASQDKTVKLWDVTTGRELRTLVGHQSSVLSVTWSPDGKSIASASQDKTVKLWDVATGRELRTLRHKDVVRSVAWNPDGKSIASAGDDKTVKLWDAVTGHEFRTLTGHEEAVRNVAWSPDGKSIASAGDDKTVKLWDASTGHELRTLAGHEDAVRSVAWSPDGRSLASASFDKTVRLWDVVTGGETRILRGHQFGVRSVAWSLDGKSLASASDDKTVRLWDHTTPQELCGHLGYVWSVAWSPDGKSLASASDDKTVKLWDARTGEELRTLRSHKDSVLSVAWSPDGKSIASASKDNTVKLWDAATGQELRTLVGHQTSVFSVAWSPDGKSIASASQDKTVRLWDVATGHELRILRGHEHYVLSVAWSPDGKSIASASQDKTVKLWDAATGRELRTLHGHQDTVSSVAWSPDGKSLASAGFDKTVRLWDAATGQEIRTLRGHRATVRSAEWSPDGKYIASAGNDNAIKLWDPATARELRTFDSQTSAWIVAWSPDGESLASARYDATVRIYPLNPGLLLNLVRGRIRQVTLSPEECQHYFGSVTCPALD